MKRSKMIDILESWFFSEFGEEKGGDALISANRMLDLIESLGMLPPSVSLPVPESSGNNFIYSKNEWEKE